MSDWKNELATRLASLRLAPERETEIIEELSQHLDDAYQHALLDGLTAEEAKAVALDELADHQLLINELRRSERAAPLEPAILGHGRRGNVFEDLLQDIRYGVRALAKNLSFTTVAVIALALGIGANTAIFSVVNAVLLRPLPFKDPSRLIMIWEDASFAGFPHNTPSAADFLDWQNQNQSFSQMSAIERASFNLTNSGDPERLDGRRVSGNFFNMLGVEPQLGRHFTAAEDKAGASHVVMLSNALWQRRFASDPGVVGKQLMLNGESYTVVGVMPPSFQFPTSEDLLWTPLAFTNQEATNRGRHYLQVVGRLKDGVTEPQAQAEMSTIASRLEQQYPRTNTRVGITLVPLHDELVGDIKSPLLLLLGAVAFVLLVACANVANLLLARGAVRQKEIATRVALGASRWRLARQFLTESLLLSLLGGLIGVMLAAVAVYLLRSLIPAGISQADLVGIDLRVLGFTLLISLVTGIVFGLAPITQASNFNLNETLKEGGRDSSAGSRGHRTRSLLVVGEVAISLVLLIGAGLLVNSFIRLSTMNPGFRTDHLLTMNVVLPDTKYREDSAKIGFYDDLVQRVESLPGVKSAAVINSIPLVLQGDSFDISIEGRPEYTPDTRPEITTRAISAHYLKTMGIELLKGREFNEHDRADSTPVAIISKTMAQRLWPNEDPVGKRLKPGSLQSNDPWIEVVGIAGDVRQLKLNVDPKLQMYLPYSQFLFFAPRHLVVNTEVEPLSLAGTLRNTVWQIDRDQPVSNVSTMADVMSESVARQRFTMLLLAILAALALVLAAVGIYGVMSYSVAQRTHEIGVRMALGASTAAVLKLAISQGLRLVTIGLVIGLVIAFLLTRVMSTMLFGVTATDPMTFLIISFVLIAVAAFASYVPARRAAKVDPLVALRYE
jgi:putative ABC transport system permease protein